MKIISVVPSLTELLSDLNLEDEVIGITKFCIHPEKWFRNKTKVGGTKKLNINLIRELSPDLIIANKEENIKEEIESCQEFSEVFVSDIATYTEALQCIQKIGQLTHREEEAAQIVHKIEDAFNLYKLKKVEKKKAVYLIWKDPIMTVGGDTFINNMMDLAGFANVFSNQQRYPILTEEELTQSDPEILLLSSEPYPFSAKHLPYFKKLLPNASLLLVDGEMFSWYGSRMRLAPAYFEKILPGL